MKKIDSYILEHFENSKFSIIEKLHLGKTTKPSFNVDDLTGNKTIILYSDESNSDDEDEDNFDDAWDYCKDELDNIDKNCETGFICTRFVSLGKIKDPTSDKNIYAVEHYLYNITDKIMTGKDYGYEVRISGGHLEIDCINSGSRATYYIYQCSPEAWDHLTAWWEGDDDVKSISFLYEEDAIIAIK